jgi:hypothetical protein
LALTNRTRQACASLAIYTKPPGALSAVLFKGLLHDRMSVRGQFRR